jgi:hypothetical protein
MPNGLQTSRAGLNNMNRSMPNIQAAMQAGMHPDLNMMQAVRGDPMYMD